MYVPPTSEFIAENYEDLISKPSSLIVGDLNAYSPLWGANNTEQDLFVRRIRTTMAMSFPLLALLFGIAFHLRLVLLSYLPIFLRPYHFLKLISFLGANRTKRPLFAMAVDGRYINT